MAISVGWLRDDPWSVSARAQKRSLRATRMATKGVSEETLEPRYRPRIPAQQGWSDSRFPKDVMLYEHLVLLALAENALARQQTSSTPKVRNAS
jgi:hypothetical protein